jgi:hypothetical protein
MKYEMGADDLHIRIITRWRARASKYIHTITAAAQFVRRNTTNNNCNNICRRSRLVAAVS